MRFLVDNALSPSVAQALRSGGHDVVHVREIGLHAASDEEIFDHAAEQDRILVSADTDFGTILAHRNTAKPSVILFRHGLERAPSRQASIILANLRELVGPLEQGSLVILEPARIRVRALPLSSPE